MSAAPSRPSASFRCPNRVQALKLQRAFELWGAESAEVARQEVAHANARVAYSTVSVFGSGRFMSILAALFSEGHLDRIQRSEVDAAAYSRLFVEPGESRG